MFESARTIGIFANGMCFLVKEHEPTKTVLQLIKQRFLEYVGKLNDISNGECMVSQTGSSFDDLHLSRLLENPSGKQAFYPAIDFDFMMSYKNYKVLDKSAFHLLEDECDLQDLLDVEDVFAVMIASKQQGYVKLLLTKIGHKMLESRRPKCDFAGFITNDGLLPNTIFKALVGSEQLDDGEVLYEREKMNYTVNGPALSNMENEPDGYTYDFVHSFPCHSWPEVAVNWTTRPRPTKWPSEILIQDIIKGGCAVVPVGHHTSKEPELEWRISFNAAERTLSKSLLPIQKTCFSLVKLILKACLSSKSILTSYHVKNMMFWFCEQMYGAEEWTEDLLGERILNLFEYIEKALQHNSIPNYFVPPNNLISHRTKEEIEGTREEIALVRGNIFQTMALVCSKLQLFHEFGGLSNKSEIQHMCMIYTALVQTFYKVGLLNLFENIAITCFKNIIALNDCVKQYIKTASPAFSATSLTHLLKPVALACTQSGEINKALKLYEIMLETEIDIVKSCFPEVFSNVACLYSVKFQGTTNSESRKLFFEKAIENFEQARMYIFDSPSLHLAFGNFLLSILSVKKAMDEFRQAEAIKVPRFDDEAFMQFDIPGCEDKKTHIPGKVAALYLLCTCYVQLGKEYEARKCATSLEINLKNVKLEQKLYASFVCADAYRMCGLNVKSEIVSKRAQKYNTKQYKLSM